VLGRTLLAIAILLAVLPAAAAPVVVASKIDTEGALLGNLILLSLQRAGIPAQDRLQLGPTQIVRQALLTGAIDLYPEYTGNGAIFFADEGDAVWHQPGTGYETIKRLDREHNAIIWLTAAPADNSWAIAVRRDLAERAQLARLADLTGYLKGGGKLRLAASAEFVDSPGALPAFEKAYGFSLAPSQLLTLVGGNTAATLRAAAENISGVNAAMAYTTDGALAVLPLALLADDKHAQTVYRPAPVIRAQTLAEYPQIATILAPIFAALTLERLQSLNAAIAAEGEPPRAVAAGFLDAQARTQ
jgi:osmoprotectant transport system substrate-binding protein